MTRLWWINFTRYNAAPLCVVLALIFGAVQKIG